MDYLKSFGIDVGQGKYHEELVYGVALLYTAMFNNISAYLTQYDLTPAKMNVLMVIKHQGKVQGISQMDIGKRLLVSASNMTRVLEKLENDGLIERFSQEGDRRVRLVKTTNKGSKLLDQVWVGYQARVKQQADVLSRADQKVGSALIQQWLNKLAGV